jgi:hypothetical protein
MIVFSLLWMAGITVQIKLAFTHEYKWMGGNLKIMKHFKHFRFGYITVKCEGR